MYASEGENGAEDKEEHHPEDELLEYKYWSEQFGEDIASYDTFRDDDTQQINNDSYGWH